MICQVTFLSVCSAINIVPSRQIKQRYMCFDFDLTFPLLGSPKQKT